MSVSPDRIEEALRMADGVTDNSLVRDLAAALREAQAELAKHREASATTIRKMGAALDRAQAENERLREALHEIAGCSLPDQVQERIALAALAPADEATP